VSRLQALVDRKKVIITEATIRDVLHLDNAEGIKCLPNEDIFTELARMGYEKLSTKLTFYKAFFSSKWKFLIHTILQCMSAKRTSWNEFSSSMASAVICLSTETQLFEGMIVEQQVGKGAAEVNVEVLSTAGVAVKGATSATDDEVPAAVDEPSIPSPPPTTKPPPPSQHIPSTSQDVNLKDVATVAKDVQDAEIKENPAELQEVVEVVTTAKLITELVTAARTTITAAALQLTTAASTTLTTAASTTLTTAPKLNKKIDWDEVIDHVQRKEKEDNVVKRYQALKRKPQTKAQARKNMMIYLRNMAGFKMDYFKGMTYDDICPIFDKYFNSNVAFLEKTKEQMEEEDSRALKRISE
nr:hypothetical protein [Tanacetum cinerariifolium]